MDDFYNHLPKDDQKALEKQYVYEVPALHFVDFLNSSKPL